jgi:D-serine deaminase-like pyridoxal phosphate-dependent protein
MHYPRLILNEAICRQNISKMAEKARQNNLIFRPHFKTHQSVGIGQWFRDAGVDCIAVSSVKMASYFKKGGWKDIFIAFPLNVLEIKEINRITEDVQLSVSIESKTVAGFIAKHSTGRLGVYIKIDTGHHRTGIDPFDTGEIEDILNVIRASENLNFKGFYTHSGHTYLASGKKEITAIHDHSREKLLGLHTRYSGSFPGLILSVGDTPSCSLADDFAALDEIRPGNFAFYDVMQTLIGSCTAENIAVALECPVVAKHHRRNELVIHGGAVHLSKESIVLNGEESYGLVVQLSGSGWAEPFKNTYVARISQEHGIIRASQSVFDSIRIGGTVGILPVHSCLTANLADNYLTTTGHIIPKMRS